MATNAIRDGRPDQAAFAMDAYLAQIPDDARALLLRTEAAALQADFASAVSFGRRAFWNATTGNQRYNAARLVALGHARQMQDSRAQAWLRIARQFAPNAAAANGIAEDFRVLRRRNPLSVQLRFGVTPSSNINSGSSNEIIPILGFTGEDGEQLGFSLSEDGQALSGWEYSLNANLRYRLRTDATSATFLTFGIDARTFSLSSESQDRVDNDPQSTIRDGADLANGSLSFGIQHRFVLGPDTGLTNVGLNVSQSWRAGDPDRRFVTASVNHTWDVFDRDSFTLAGFSQQQESIDNGDRVQVFDLSGTYRTVVDGIGTFSFGAGVRDSSADDTAEDFDAVRYSIGYAPGDPLFGVNLGFNVSYEERDFDFVSLVNGARRDEITSFVARATFSDVEFFGFNPVVTFQRTRQESDAALFDRDFTEFGFDIVSSF